MEQIYVVGVGMTPFGRHLDVSMKALTRQAVEAALADAGLGKEALEAAFSPMRRRATWKANT